MKGKCKSMKKKRKDMHKKKRKRRRKRKRKKRKKNMQKRNKKKKKDFLKEKKAFDKYQREKKEEGDKINLINQCPNILLHVNALLSILKRNMEIFSSKNLYKFPLQRT